MATRNPYAVDPNLVQGFNNLTRALIGSSGTDKDMSAVRANDALTAKRNQESKNLAQQYGIVNNLRDAVTNTSGSEPFQNAIVQALTGNEIFQPQMTDEYYQAGEEMDNSLGIQSPADIATPTGQFRQGDPVLNDLARTLFGNLQYNPSQLSSAFTNIGTTNQENARNNQLVDIILNGTPEQSARALRAYSGKSGKYDNLGFAEKELAENLASDEKQNQYTADASKEANIEVQKLKNQSADKATIAQKAWEMHKIDINDKRKKYEIDEDNKVAVKKFQKEQEVIKYKFDNRTIEIQVSKDGRVYVDPITAEKMTQKGKAPIYDEETGLFYVDGQKSPQKLNVVKVEVGEKDVYLNKETANALGIKANAEGQYILKGKPKDKKSGGSGGGSSSSAANVEKTDNFNDVYSNTIGTEKQLPNYENLPQAVRGNIKSSIAGIINGLLNSEENTLSEDQLLNQIIPGTIGQGFTLITEDRNFSVPTFLITGNEPATEEELIQLGYSKDQVRRIMNYMNGQ